MSSDFIAGSVVTFVAACSGGGLGAWLLGQLEHRREDQRELREHKAAVRAVAFELTGRGVAAGVGAAVDTSTPAYDGLLVPLFSRLPGAVANEIARAYAMVKSGGGRAGADVYVEAANRLMAYGETLGLTFPTENSLRLSRLLFRSARRAGDIEALASGDSVKIAKRARNRAVGRAVGRALARAGFWRRLWR